MRKFKTITKRVATIILAGAMILSFAGCQGVSEDSTEKNSTGTEDTLDSAEDDTEDSDATEATEDSGDSEESLTVEEALQQVADLNGCDVEDLNYSLDSEGYVDFLGATFSDVAITDAESAMDSIDYIVDLAGLDGCEYSFYREDISPVSGYTYYTFNQVTSGTDEDDPVVFSNSSVKIITDSNGTGVGFSADVTRGDYEEIDSSNYIDQTEAEETVKAEMESGTTIYSEASELTYWDDEGKASEVSNAKVIPVWAVYTDESLENQPYTMYLVYALRVDEECVIVDKVGAKSLGTSSNDEESYTSELFFSGMENAGNYTYEVDMTWAVEANSGYNAANPLEVTVPVMYDPESGLYYLADYDERIAVANYYDFDSYNEVNAVVTETPEDLSSWHFAAESLETDEGTITYFCDPNYLVATYWCMESVYQAYKDRYGFNSVDTSGLPILLTTYLCDDGYPEAESDFTDNACNAGQIHDWDIFATSPVSSMCVEFGTLAHEFAHGINSQLASAQYMNAMGAVMEGYADSIGDNLATVYGMKDSAYDWIVGSEWSAPMRSFSDPYSYNNAKYIGGKYYIGAVSDCFADVTDCGGVHENSSVVNYLCYSLCNSEEGGAVIDIGDAVDLFVETLYCANYDTGFNELGAYLIMAAESQDFSEDQLSYVYDTIYKLGFTGDYTQLEELIAEDGGATYSFGVSTDSNTEDYAFAVMLSDEEGTMIGGGEIENGETYNVITDDSVDAYASLNIGDTESGSLIGVCDLVDSSMGESVTVTGNACSAGETLELEGALLGYSYLDSEGELATDDEGYTFQYVEDGTYDMTFDEAGTYCLSTYDEDYNTTIVIVTVE